ncbi:DgyrCDS14957 [Dimorphilus gyrociliatus]|uniref:DgyrCDS14957 n=1 Tax=Dimorphilus gyrociliatus TaxID=2664684 RepID=A0A7I8WFS1_9ANNE|nr:DgyrCDS14957 [Dimorphilus gyrociliatus]
MCYLLEDGQGEYIHLQPFEGHSGMRHIGFYSIMVFSYTDDDGDDDVIYTRISKGDIGALCSASSGNCDNALNQISIVFGIQNVLMVVLEKI